MLSSSSTTRMYCDSSSVLNPASRLSRACLSARPGITTIDNLLSSPLLATPPGPVRAEGGCPPTSLPSLGEWDRSARAAQQAADEAERPAVLGRHAAPADRASTL